MTDEQILELAKNFEFDFSIKWRLKGGESRNEMNWECWEEQLLKFALAIHENGYSKGYCEGHKSGSTGVFGEPEPEYNMSFEMEDVK